MVDKILEPITELTKENSLNKRGAEAIRKGINHQGEVQNGLKSFLGDPCPQNMFCSGLLPVLVPRFDVYG